jgi:hypothetical protein
MEKNPGFTDRVDMRNQLLVIAGARAAYMDCANAIDIPLGLDMEDEFSAFVVDLVDKYILEGDDVNFDEYIEKALLAKYKKYDPVYEAYKLLIGARDTGDEIAIDEAIGYLGEALGE